MSQLASSYINMTGREMHYIVNVPVYTFTYKETTWHLDKPTSKCHTKIRPLW